ncbi:M56 family metallopeptidase [Kutzneria buriramensis]|uniref:Zn-dependent protease with chaperone function n=1 Tax=Kutzneria buriramensis TaxID=1045776 RepID=A0A3E0H6R3_9PSEU|nr:M56 family metallopeptidase [Kutzneria buriramensis]REH39161.1 Zn-dependent protease with chaperone function [Kutzneria buriramensis]
MAASSRFDERVLGAGTTVRFALLAVLLLVASGSMMRDVVAGLSGAAGVGCELAAGADPDSGILQIELVIVQQKQAYDECMAHYQPGPPWWLVVAWPLLVLVVAGVLFLLTPRWKVRRRRLKALDHDVARRLIEEAALTAGLSDVPRVVVDRTSIAGGAVVFGSSRRPTVCIHSGLLVRATTDPDRFRAVLLHELAHIRHGDVTLTYATVALWRAFLGAVLIPYAVWAVTALVQGFSSSWWSSDEPFGLREVLLVVFLVALLYLARSDVLRSREIHADLAAARWGAAERAWDIPSPRPTGRFRRLLGQFAELWRTHPRWDLRQDAMTDPAVLFGVRALPMFLTGVAATLINSQLRSDVEAALARDGLVSGWLDQALPLAAAGLVVGVAGFALWRAVAHAVLTSRRVPSGVRAGLWLGAGMAAGELALNQVAVTEWLPPHPEALLLVVLAGAGVFWWIGQAAYLWTTTWRGASIRPATVACLATAGLALSSWFLWWRSDGILYTNGWPFGIEQSQFILAAGVGGPVAAHEDLLAAVAVGIPIVQGFTDPALVLTAVGALWIVPLLAWTIRPADGAPRWLRAAVQDVRGASTSDTSLPRLRRVLLPGVLAGVAAWIAVAVVQAYLHTWRPVPASANEMYMLIYLTWVLVAVVAAVVVAAAVAGVRATRHRLLTTLIAAETAAVVGFAGMLVLMSVDGCIGPLSTLESSCGWHSTGTTFAVDFVLTPVSVVGAIAAVIAAAIGTLRRSTDERALSTSRTLTGRRAVVGTLGTVAVVVAAIGIVQWTGRQSQDSSIDVAQLFHTAADLPVSDRTRAAQAYAWFAYGGEDVNVRLDGVEGRYLKVLNNAGSDVSPLLPVCVEFGRLAADADRLFRVPDAQAQTQWRDFITQLGQGSKDCRDAIKQQGPESLLLHALDEFDGAEQSANAVLARLEQLMGRR